MRPPPRRTSTPARVLRETWITPVAIGDARDVLPPSLLPPGNAEPLRRYPCERFDDALLMFGGGRIRSSSDSPLEGDGFEPSVPLVNASAPCCRRECRSDRTGKSRDRSIPHERARNPFTSPVCPSASEIAARSPRMRAARDGVATAPGLSRQRASGQCDVGTVRAAGQPATFASLR
jgi:hypothetical protein